MTVFSASLADPTGSSAIVAAARWWQGALLGGVATTIAVLAVAAVGFLMLTGRLHIRRGATVLLGCFLLFGAPTIASGLHGSSGDGVEARSVVSPPLILPPPAIVPPSLPAPVPYDPYAGAAVPMNR